MYTKLMVQVQAKATRIEKGKKSSEGKKKKKAGDLKQQGSALKGGVLIHTSE